MASVIWVDTPGEIAFLPAELAGDGVAVSEAADQPVRDGGRVVHTSLSDAVAERARSRGLTVVFRQGQPAPFC